MKTTLIFIFCLYFSFSVFSQNDTNVLVINHVEDKLMPQNGKMIKEIAVRRTENRTFKQLIEQVKDSARRYGGNCFLITQYDLGDPVFDLGTMRLRDYMKGQVYLIDSIEKQFLEAQTIKKARERDSLKVNYKNKDIELVIGFDLGGFRLAANQGYTQAHDELLGDTYGSLYLIANRTWQFPTFRNNYFHLGAGLSRTALLFNPNITLQDAGIADIDTVRVIYIDNREFQILFPVGFTHTFPNLIEKGTGLKVMLGLENRFQVGRRDMETTLFGDSEVVYEDETHNDLAHQHYNSFLNPYTLMGTMGLGLSTHDGVGFEIRYSRFIIPPFLNGQPFNQEFIFSFQVDIQLFNFR